MNIQWRIDQLFCYPAIGDYVDVVFSAAWRVTGTDGTDGTYSAVTTGQQSLNPYATGSTFIPYEDLQEAQVIAWVQNAMGDSQVAAINAGIEQKIAAQITPTVITPPLPWATV